MEMSFSTARRRVAVAAAATTLALAATACEGSSDDAAKSVSSSNVATPAAASLSAADTTSPTQAVAGAMPPPSRTPEVVPTSQDGSTGSPSPKDTSAAPATTKNVKQSSVPPCSEANSELAVDQVDRPVNHLLLTVTNTGTTPCDAYHAPLLRFEQAEEAVQILTGSQPQAVVTLVPGASAYAGINTSSADGAGTGAFTAGELRVTVVDRIGSAGAGTTTLRLPRPTYVDDAAFSTYWQGSSDDALAW
ncbi:DUF4232 domain-containing protein [Kitasatospora sp. NPDC001603]|uniref:DUF4232 domain-containing protein n=1 Tax=Kitasatospora sp. NPDC001603 TaxID=3154388 RepID=UPI00331A43D9